MKAKVWKYTKEKTKQESSFHSHVNGKKKKSSYGQRNPTRLETFIEREAVIKKIKVFASRIKIISNPFSFFFFSFPCYRTDFCVLKGASCLRFGLLDSAAIQFFYSLDGKCTHKQLYAMFSSLLVTCSAHLP